MVRSCGRIGLRLSVGSRISILGVARPRGRPENRGAGLGNWKQEVQQANEVTALCTMSTGR